jgi:hypothetical protein
MRFKLLANHIKDQVILVHPRFKKVFLEGKCLENDVVETKDKHPYSNGTDVI